MPDDPPTCASRAPDGTSPPVPRAVDSQAAARLGGRPERSGGVLPIPMGEKCPRPAPGNISVTATTRASQVAPSAQPPSTSDSQWPPRYRRDAPTTRTTTAAPAHSQAFALGVRPAPRTRAAMLKNAMLWVAWPEG